jgi:uncharacterized GH25 family protein
MRCLGLLLLIMVGVSSAKAQVLWLQSQKYFGSVGEKVPVSMVWGDGFNPVPWNLKREQVNKVELHHLSAVKDLKSNLKDGEKDQVEVLLVETGTHLLTLQTNSVLSTVDAEKFNDYLKTHGLDEIYFNRERSGALTKPVQERSAYYAKVLLQAGEEKDDTYKKPTDFPIEIIPEKSPFTLKTGDAMRFSVRWQGKPLFGIQVKIWNRHNNLTTQQNIYTQQDGTMETRVSNGGLWIISVVQMVPGKQGVDWQSYRGSLVFELK